MGGWTCWKTLRVVGERHAHSCPVDPVSTCIWRVYGWTSSISFESKGRSCRSGVGKSRFLAMRMQNQVRSQIDSHTSCQPIAAPACTSFLFFKDFIYF